MASKELINASFDVDAQCGFSPLCPNELPVPNGDQIVEALNGNSEYATYRLGSKDLHPSNAIWHTDAEHSDDVTIGTCWDADRLDLGRVGIIPDEAFMSTDFGKEIARKGSIYSFLKD